MPPKVAPITAEQWEKIFLVLVDGRCGGSNRAWAWLRGHTLGFSTLQRKSTRKIPAHTKGCGALSSDRYAVTRRAHLAALHTGGSLGSGFRSPPRREEARTRDPADPGRCSRCAAALIRAADAPCAYRVACPRLCCRLSTPLAAISPHPTARCGHTHTAALQQVAACAPSLPLYAHRIALALASGPPQCLRSCPRTRA